jgi:transposase
MANPIGRPTLYDKNFHPEDFIRQSKSGKNIKQIALAWDISRSVIYKWAEKNKEFADTLKKGQELCEAWYMDLGQAAMLGMASQKGQKIKVDLGFFVWMTKNVCHWSDRMDQKTDHTTKGEKIEKSVMVIPANGSEKKD